MLKVNVEKITFYQKNASPSKYVAEYVTMFGP